ncbi:bridging integrator 3 homolog [Artemia franciscana]|uniref:BAR domain-containing protein n=1 Tax=Artemia franciscana TaxID=6661 RepID=A0AA88HWY6_ARTSF|nr:hypothetical protein QYM36_006226 [Artemia franciscana]KAK2717365.1 hypothetical protein QYM36_006226 [Artemia franciscana]
MKLASHLNESLANSSDGHKQLSHSFDAACKKISEKANDLSRINSKCAIEPMKRFRKEFSNLQQEYIKRNQLLKKCQETKAEIDKLSKKDRTGSNYVKLEQAKKNYQIQQNAFLTCNTRLLRESKQLYDLRAEYFNPSLMAILEGQIDFCGESLRAYKELPLPNKPMSDIDFNSDATVSLNAIKKLAITGGKGV